MVNKVEKITIRTEKVYRKTNPEASMTGGHLGHVMVNWVEKIKTTQRP